MIAKLVDQPWGSVGVTVNCLEGSKRPQAIRMCACRVGLSPNVLVGFFGGEGVQITSDRHTLIEAGQTWMGKPLLQTAVASENQAHAGFRILHCIGHAP